MQFVISYKSKNSSNNKYKVIKSFGEFEIRKYEKLFVASSIINSSNYDESSSYGFRTLANYIFGQNKRSQKIAMTSPVIMDMNDSITMSFIMPDEVTQNNAPDPLSNSVKLQTRPNETFAVIRFGGWANQKKIQSKTSELKKHLLKYNIEYFGDPVYLGYDSPYQMVDRRNEVALRVKYK